MVSSYLLRGKLARGRPKMIPLRMPHFWPLCRFGLVSLKTRVIFTGLKPYFKIAIKGKVVQVFAQEPIQPFSFPPIIFQVFHRYRSLIKCKRNQPTGFENMACFLACFDKIATLPLWLMVHFTFVCLVDKPLNRSEARDDLVMIQKLQRIKCELLCYHVN